MTEEKETKPKPKTVKKRSSDIQAIAEAQNMSQLMAVVAELDRRLYDREVHAAVQRIISAHAP